MKITLSTVNVEVRDLAASKLFYMSVLHLKENEQRSHAPTFSYLESGACAITLTTPPNGGTPLASQSIEIGFETDDIEAFKRHLDILGVKDVTPQTMGWGSAVELHDPDGNRIIVYAFPSH